MGAIAGLLAGVGMLLIWMACTSDPPQWRSRRSRLLADILVQAGAGRTSPTMFVLGSIGLGLLIGLVFLGMSRAWPVAVSFTAIFTAIPFLVISSRARNRRTRLREVWPEAVDTLVSGVRAGMSLPEALTNLGERGPEVVRPSSGPLPATTPPPPASTALWTGSRPASPTLSPTGSLRPCAWPMRSVALIWGRCCVPCRRCCARTCAPVESLRPASPGRSTAPRSRSPPRGSSVALLSTRTQAAAAYATTAGAVVLLIGAVVSVAAYRLMLRLGRLPEEERTLR